MSDQDFPPTPPPDDSPRGERQLRIPLDPQMLVVLALAAAGLLLMCIFGALLLAPEGGFFNRSGTTSEEEETGLDLVATPSGENIVVVSDGVNTLSIDLDPPAVLTVGETEFAVKAQFVPQNGRWIPSGEAGMADWVYGSIVNYVFGLQDTAANRTLLEGLTPGDRILLTTLNGTQREFAVTGRELSGASNADLFAQNRPRMTLVWLGSLNEEQRLVVFADFVLPQEQGTAASAPAAVEIGEVAQLADVRMTVSSTSQVVDSPAAPPGFSLFLVDFDVENIGQSPLDTGLLRLALIDELSNQYSLNAAASQEGRYPILSGFIDPGTIRQSTAGYQIPSNLTSSRLRWVVTRVDSPGQIEVNLPFSGISNANLAVSLQQADISTDGTSLIVTGQVTNLASQPVIIGESNVRLESNGALYLVFSTSPGFPWAVNAGQSLPFALTFQRPATSTAIFTIMGQSFELSGLR